MAAVLGLEIVVDSREQAPFTFERFGARTERRCLCSGDYAIAGHEVEFAVERKRLGEMFAMAGRERARFERELERLATYPAGAAVVIEGPWAALEMPRWGSGAGRSVSPASVKGSVLAWMLRFRIPFVFCSSRSEAEEVTYGMLRRFHLDVGRGASCAIAHSE